MTEFEASECSCDICQNMCKSRPCWPTPEEVKALISAGYGPRLMNDWWCGDGEGGGDIQIISPASSGCESYSAPSFEFGKCTFLTEDGLCELHNLGLKPIEGRVASCKSTPKGLHGQVAQTWNNSEGRELVKLWWRLIGKEGD